MKEKSAISNGTLNDLKGSLTEQEFNEYSPPISKKKPIIGPSSGGSDDVHGEVKYAFVMFDLETTGLDRESDIIQNCLYIRR